ncbi:type VI secretion system tip protein VgrG, partial [Malaciobacter halophilus]
EETIQKDSIITVGEEERKSIKANKILTVEKESITTIKQDCEKHYKQNLETLIKQDEKTYLERDVELRIKNILHKYIQKDVSDKYLQNLFVKIGKELRVDIEDGFHLNTSDLKVQASDNCLLDGSDGISFKCGSNILTVDSSGIHFNTSNFVDNSANGGVSVEDVKNKGAIIDLRANDSFRDYIYDIQEDQYVLRANSSLKNGTKVEASCFILGKEKEILAKEIKTISVENSKLEARFDLDEIIHLNQIPESKIKNIKGIFSWQN